MSRSLAPALSPSPQARAAAGRSSPAPTPPVAPRKDHAQVWHGRTFVDPYYWLREKGSPDVVKYLEAENAYTEATTADLKPFSEALYAEMLGRIKQTDLSVPTRDGRFYYYRRTVEGQQYPIRCRKPAGPDGAFRESAPEEVLLDQNEMAKGLPFLSVGAFEVSDDDARLLYSTDDTGFRQYKLFVKDLKTGAVQGPLAERVTSATWAADNRTVFYVTEHPVTKRPDTLWRLELGRPAGEGLRGEGRALLDRGRADQGQEVRRPRQPVDRHLGPAGCCPRRRRAASSGPSCPARRATSTTSSTATAPSSSARTRTRRTSASSRRRSPTPRRASWKPFVEHRPDVLLDDVEVFRDFVVRPGEAGRPQPPARPRLRRRQLEGGRLPRARLHRLRRRARRSSTRSSSATATRASSRPRASTTTTWRPGPRPS